MFFLKIDVNPQGFQATHRRKQRYRVSRKPGEGFGEDKVDFTVLAVIQHFLEPGAVFFCTRQGFIGIDPGKLPVSTASNIAVVIANLGRQGV